MFVEICCVVIGIVALIFVLDYLIHSSKEARSIDKIHGPKGYPLIRNVLEYNTDTAALFEILRRNNKKYERFHKLWMINIPLLNLYEPDDVEVLMTSSKNINKGHVYNFIHTWLNDGLLLSKGAKWHFRRKILTPTFHFNILSHFCEVFEEHSKVLVNKIRSEADGKIVEIFPYITQFTLYAICETAMGLRLDRGSPDNRKYMDAVDEMGDLFIKRVSRIWMHPDFIFYLTADGKRQKDVLKTLHAFTTNVIQQRRKTFQNDNVNQLNDHDAVYFNEKKRMAMLDLLLKSESTGEIDELGIREEVDTFMFEGHDTTTISIACTLMLLAQHKNIQDKIFQELVEIFGDSDRPATIEDLNRMKYLKCCIKESLRLYPSVPIIMRELSEDMHLRDHIIPANTSVLVHIYDLHRNPNYFPSPEKFDPDRFLPENCAGRHPFAYIPFSAGPRNCIGQKFAILEEQSVISNIIRNFHLEPVTKIDDIKFDVHFVLRTKIPIKIKFTSRNKG